LNDNFAIQSQFPRVLLRTTNRFAIANHRAVSAFVCRVGLPIAEQPDAKRADRTENPIMMPDNSAGYFAQLWLNLCRYWNEE
jgi:hypothetical protein